MLRVGSVGIVGATGAVGRTMLSVLEESNVEIGEVSLFASERSSGQVMKFRGKDVTVETLSEEAMRRGFDYLLFIQNGPRNSSCCSRNQRTSAKELHRYSCKSKLFNDTDGARTLQSP